MTRTLRFSTTLVAYDGPEIVLGEDVFGAVYIALLVERDPREDTYLVSAISPKRLADLLSGRTDLRPIFAQPEDALYCLRTRAEPSEEWLELEAADSVPQDWYPDEGFLVSEFLPDVAEEDATLRAEAAERNRAVIHLALGPRTHVGPPRIGAEALSGALHAFQHLMKQAFRRSTRNLPQELKEHFADPEHYELEVYGFSPGSFQVHLQAKSLPDLFGGAPLERGFRLVDAMTAALASPEASLDAVRENRGHLASAYSTFLEFVKEADELVRYSWTTPGGEVTHRAVTPDQASIVLEVLRREKELGSEWRELEGVFTKVNTKTGSWTLENRGGKESHGSLHEEADDLLSGVVVKEASYKLTCEEVLGEVLGTGRNKTKLLLRHLEKL